jgi:hypothetical protein
MAYIDLLTKSTEAKSMAVSPDWVLQKVVTTINTGEEKNNLSAVLRGLELLARHFGMLTDKQEITGKDGGAIEIEQRSEEDAKNFVDILKTLVKKNEKSSDSEVKVFEIREQEQEENN